MVSIIFQLGPSVGNNSNFTCGAVHTSRMGVVNESNVIPIIEHLNGSSAMSQRPFDVELCMESNQEIREAYWN